jgi:hypothetical protein
MAAVFGNVGASAGEVNDFHSNSDVDKSTLAQHHTLGPQPNQAAPGDHVHDGKTSKKIFIQDLDGVSVSYQPQGGTLGATQPTFSGDPLITGSYTKIGNLVWYQIDVDFSNILTFGTGQYYLTLPFASEHTQTFRQGCLDDFSTSRRYAISGHVEPGSNQLLLSGLTSNGLDEDFTYNTPTALAVEDSFHVAGTYEIIP